MPNLYVTRAVLKARADIASTDTADDDTIDAVISSVSRLIDRHTGRWFYPQIQTRYFTPDNNDHIPVGDLLSISALSSDSAYDRTYATTWAATDYDLEPANALQESPPRPYSRVCMNWNTGRYWFPITARGIKITGSWGYYDVRQTSSATLSEALDTSETGVDVSSGTAFQVGQTILIDSEQMTITTISTNTLTVARGVNGTTAASHLTGLSIDVYQYPIVSEAAAIQSARILKRKDSPLGVAGGAEFGVIRLARLDPDVAMMLQLFRDPVTA